MNEDINLAEIIENDILSFSGVSRFPGISFTGSIQKERQ